jgi:ribosomal protein S6--L-glutamate ligase
LRIGVLSRDVELPTTDRLIAAGARRGHEVFPLRLLDLAVLVGAEGPRLLLRGEPCPPLDAFVPRLGSYLPALALAAARALISAGVVPLSDPAAMACAHDKLRTAERLVAAGIPTPRTILAKDLDHLDFAIDAVGGAPVVIKPVTGAQGRGVMVAGTRAEAVAILENLIVAGRDHLVQELVAGALGEDLRVLVIDGEVAAAMRRRARPGEFRTNLHRGGSAEAVEATARERELACAAACAVGLDFAGIDLLAGERGPVVVEVNGSPGLEGIERASGLDLAGRAIDSLERRVAAARGGAGSPERPAARAWTDAPR